MNLPSKSTVMFLILLLSCDSYQEKKPIISRYASTEHLMEAEALISASRQDHIKIIDFRKPEVYHQGHICGALNIWRPDIEDPSYPYGGMMPPKEQVTSLFSRLGIEPNDTLIVYDDKGACDAARLWWVLKYYNFESVKILNGGLKSWKNAGGVINDQTVSYPTSRFTFPQGSSHRLWIGKEELEKMVSSDREVIILDTRNITEYSGKRLKKGAFKAGRIPGSILIDWLETVDHGGTQKFKPYNDLKKIYDTLGRDKNHPIIAYCHSGVRSAHTVFVLTELLGYKQVRNYDGSWIEWSYFNHLPSEQDSITTIHY